MDTKRKIKFYTRLINELLKEGLNDELFWAYFERGLYYSQIYDYESAVSDFIKAASINPKEPMIYYHIGIAYLKMKKYELARLNLEKVIEMSPEESSAYFDLANICYEEGKYDKACKFYTESIIRGKKTADVYYRRANAFLKLGKKNEALSDISHAIRIKPSNADYISFRAGIYLSIRDYDSLLKDLDMLIKFEKTKNLGLLNRSIVYATLASLIKTLTDKENLLPSRLTSIIKRKLGNFNHNHEELYNLAENDINQVIDNLSSNTYIQPSHYIVRGAIRLSQKKYVLSTMDFCFAKNILCKTFLLKKDPTYISLAALVNMYLDDYKEAYNYISMLDKTFKTEPKFDILKACWWWRSEGNFNETFYWFTRSINNGLDIFDIFDDVFEGYFLRSFLWELEKRNLLSEFIKEY